MSEILGQDAEGNDVRIGDTVDHTEKGFKDGIITAVVDGGYRGEPAVLVDYSATGGPSSWCNRLSKLVVVAPAEDFKVPESTQESLQPPDDFAEDFDQPVDDVVEPQEAVYVEVPSHTRELKITVRF